MKKAEHLKRVVLTLGKRKLVLGSKISLSPLKMDNLLYPLIPGQNEITMARTEEMKISLLPEDVEIFEDIRKDLREWKERQCKNKE